MLHLAKCSLIKKYFWDKIGELMDKLGIPRGEGPRFWILGERHDKNFVDKEGAGLLFIAWRCLYAEIVRARILEENMNLKNAYARTILLTISRLKAQGQKWYRWFSKTKNISEHKFKIFPVKYRKRRLITTQRDAAYNINPTLIREYERVKLDRLGR